MDTNTIKWCVTKYTISAINYHSKCIQTQYKPKMQIRDLVAGVLLLSFLSPTYLELELLYIRYKLEQFVVNDGTSPRNSIQFSTLNYSSADILIVHTIHK